MKIDDPKFKIAAARRILAREGAESDITIRWRVEGTDGLARGTIGWPSYPAKTPSTLDFTSKQQPGYWLSPRWMPLRPVGSVWPRPLWP